MKKGTVAEEILRRRRAKSSAKAKTEGAPADKKQDNPPQPEGPPWPDPLHAAAFHGLAGDFVRLIEPASEADPAALLLQFLVGFGQLVGRTAHFRVEGVKHFANEFLALVGQTSKARKGTSWGRIDQMLREVEAAWAEDRLVSGLSSGEGVIWNVRDPITTQKRVRGGKGEAPRYEAVVSDDGVKDKRLLVVEAEFATVLRQVERTGNTLSAVLRQAWESGNLRSLTKNSPARATDAHVSVIGHVTGEELRRYLTATESANGFANRFLWVCVRRSKSLPFGGHVDEGGFARLRERLVKVLARAKVTQQVIFDGRARELWRAVYAELSEGKPGLVGALTGRAEAHTVRLSMIYALLDGSYRIRVRHLAAALAVWVYCEQSVRYIFGESLGDPVADDVLRTLRACPAGVTRTDLVNSFGRHLPAARLGAALALLVQHRLVKFESQQTKGRPVEVWTAVRTGAGLISLNSLISQAEKFLKDQGNDTESENLPCEESEESEETPSPSDSRACEESEESEKRGPTLYQEGEIEEGEL